MKLNLKFASLVMLSLAGCSGGPSGPPLPENVEAAGVVTIDEKPLAHAMVNFIPTGSTKGIGSIGVTDADGKFEVMTSNGRSKTMELGAPAGTYKVAVSKFKKPDGSDYVPDPDGEPPANVGAIDTIEPRYSDPVMTELVVTVPPGGGDDIKITLSSQ